jgi:hypothetical protein
MVGKAAPIGFVSPQTVSCLRPWSLPLHQCFCVSDHGRKGFANVFVSPQKVSCLRPLSLLLRQCFCVFDHGLCFIANVVGSSTMVFASSPMFLGLQPWSSCLRALSSHLRPRFSILWIRVNRKAPALIASLTCLSLPLKPRSGEDNTKLHMLDRQSHYGMFPLQK